MQTIFRKKMPLGLYKTSAISRGKMIPSQFYNRDIGIHPSVNQHDKKEPTTPKQKFITVVLQD
ncbi:hypothetical protein HQ45_01260 [Porphyromonas crevioricanis]|nr:hypothetical protein HQ45_01260 [Porphyromonas crevioricanis]GAD06951.1 hypothetical protein PORCAN_561 [Porphyromonas crevioricanis JCM 13913]